MKKALVDFFQDESGATALEYILIATFMGIALVAATPILSSAVSAKFTTMAGWVNNIK